MIQGDCLEVMRGIASDSLDSLVTDPPAGISFMGKEWDGDKGGRQQWIDWMALTMGEARRVLKPGAHGLVWALPRTSHWTATALENAGFEVRDVVTHLFGTGFPKSLDISKAIDKAAGAEREYLGEGPYSARKPHKYEGGTALQISIDDPRIGHPITAPSTSEAKQWQGWGTALKPASEHWILVRKPLEEKTVAKNVLLHGTGGINIDECRVEGGERLHLDATAKITPSQFGAMGGSKAIGVTTLGRFPSNLILDEAAADMLDEQSGNLPSGGKTPFKGKNALFPIDNSNRSHFKENGGASRFFKCFSNVNTCDTSVEWPDQNNSKTVNLVESNSNLDEQPQNFALEAVKTFFKNDHRLNHYLDSIPDFKKCILFQDLASHVVDSQNIDTTEIIQNLLKLSGCVHPVTDENISKALRDPIIESGQTRFLYCPKASKSDRNSGLPEGEKSSHPTVKSTALMQYLIKLVTPPGGTVLDPFMGSGSTGVAAKALGFGFVGIEREHDYFEIAKKRIEA